MKSNFKSKKIKLEKQLSYEIKNKIDKPVNFKKYFKRVFNHARKINFIIKKIKRKNKNIFGFGASTKGNVLLHLSKIDDKLLNGIFDVNEEKFNKFTPNTKIKILDEKKLKKEKVDFILLLIWHFKGFVTKKIKKFNKNIKIIIPFPKIKII